MSDEITDRPSARADLLYPVATNPLADPGNSPNLGLEIDARLTYTLEKQGAPLGRGYGVLFPVRALSQAETIYATSHEAEIAQTVQVKLAVRF